MARRFSLREFQQNVLNRIQASVGVSTHISTLGVQIGGQSFLVAMSDISEVLPMPALSPVPLTKPWFLGVANIRGNLYCITDLAALAGQGETARGQSNRVLLLADRYAFNAGLLVSNVLGLRDSSTWQKIEQDGAPCMRDELGQVWHILDIGSLLQRADFLQIGV